MVCMSETRDLIKLITLVIVLGLIGIGLAHWIGELRYYEDLTVDYSAKLNISDVLILEEHYIYHVSNDNKYRMLFRIWKAPMLFEKVEIPCVVFVYGKTDGIPYAKDYYGNVRVWGDGVVKSLVAELAERNEVGFVNPSRFPTGDYEALYLFEVYPPIQTDGAYDHINIKLADEHVPYKSVTIQIYDPNDAVVKLYPHIQDCSIHKDGNTWVIKGKSPRNGLIEVEMILKHGTVHGFYQNVEDVMTLTEEANAGYYMAKTVHAYLKYVLMGLILCFPLIVLFAYSKYGKEKSFTVPNVLSYVPNPNRKPWEVNVVFKGDAMRGDKNAFFATLLDLQRRGVIDIEPYESKEGKILKRKGKDLRIRILNRDVNTIYERQVLNFIESYSENGVFDTARLRKLAKDKDHAISIADDLNNLFSWKDAKYAKQFVDPSGKRFFVKLSLVFLLLGFIILLSGIYMFNTYRLDFLDCIILAFVPLAQSICCALSPSQLLGRWKGDFYREKLEWNAFRRFLSDFAMIKKYAPEDLVVWKDWLVYGTALGVGDNVVKAMESLNIRVPELRVYHYYPAIYHVHRTAVKTARSGGGAGAGGFGFGGGFGGGGAGGR